MKKRLLALCMSLCLLVGLLPTAAWAADTQAENASGFCDAEENGESVKWELSPDEDDSSAYTLTISGEGAMAARSRLPRLSSCWTRTWRLP